MRRVCFVLLGIILLSPTFAQTASHTGQNWQLENKCLRVNVDAQSGTWQVLDKQAGYTWRSPDAAATATTMLLVPQAQAAPQVDGTLSEWADKGALVALTPQMTAHAAKTDGAGDCSARVRVLWAPEGLYLAADVNDDKLVTPAADEQQWWEKDSLEFWLDNTQYAFRFGPWGAHLWSPSGVVQDAKVAWRPAETGYQLEAALPPALVGQALKLAGAVRFAVGLNDSDGNGRECQLYYPVGWAHSNPETFAQATMVDAEGKAPAERVELQPKLQPVAAAQKGQLAFKAQTRGSKPFEVTLTITLLGDSPDLQVTIDCADREQAVGRFGVLQPLVLDRPGRILAAVYNDGIGVPTGDMSYRGRNWVTWGSLDMPWVGLTDGKLGYMLLWELPVTCDNGMATLEGVKLGEQTLLAPAVYHEPMMKKFGAPRVYRYSFCADGGHVAICKRFREYIKGQGLLVTQAEKLQRKPNLARLLGAPDIWGRSDLKFASEANAAGMKRLLLNSPQSAADMEKIKSLGHLMGVYDNYEDAFEGDKGNYGKFVEADDVVILADGSRMKAWVTKGDNPKQFMKRCGSLFEEVARWWIPQDLSRYPYNARFLDVTTATSLQECYHERHPHDRSQDREAKRRLAKYVGDDLNLVLGGEHGRWWGADIFNYWEGMQSGGFYSWPAGYVGMDLPKTREEIGKTYLEWGLGETNRYPLWELVYHDCVVSTWYWGDSTGHLLATAPELGYKQDAFNALYGTVPLYWVSQPYSYNWGKPELRERLLESYRNTCKLHEQIGFEEMTSHEFVTEDRHVQRTTFGDGTNVWVNFGEQPWTLAYKGKQYVLPQYGFYAQGPKIEQFRVVQGKEQVTKVQSPGYLFADASIPGLIESSGGWVSCELAAPGRLRLNVAPGTEWVKLNVASLSPGSKGAWRVLELNADSQPCRLGPALAAEGGMVRLEPGKATALVLVGQEALAGHAELVLGAVTLQPAQPKQGQALDIAVKVTNLGGKAAKGVPVELRLGEPVMAQTKVDIPAGQTAQARLKLGTETYDGPLNMTLAVAGNAAEVCALDNAAPVRVTVEPDWSLWDTQFELSVTPPAGVADPVVRLPLTEQQAGGKSLAATRVVLLQGNEQVVCPAQVLVGEKGAELLFRLPGKTEGPVTCRVYMDSQANRHAQGASGRWDDAAKSYQGDMYSVSFVEGYLKGVYGGEPWTKILSSLGVSSKDTGWVDEEGEVQSFEVVSDGPVCTQVRVKKALSGNHFYDKLYTMFTDHFLVQMLDWDRFGSMSRSYYLPDGQYEDDKGNKAVVDGKGDAEDISGQNPNPRWYVIRGDGWAVTTVPVTPFGNLGYWDGGNKAGVGFDGPSGPGPATVAYYVHPTPQGTSQEIAERDIAHAQTKTEVAVR